MRRAPEAFGAALLAAAYLAGPSASASQHRNAVDCDLGGCDIPWAWDDNRTPPPENSPYPQGFALTVQVPPAVANMPMSLPARLDRYPQVADALSRCWDPTFVGDHHWGAITVRVSFKSDGTVNGEPRITYVDHLADRSIEAGLRHSLLASLAQCTPLPFSASLGRAVAGQIFTIRFVQRGLST